LEFKDYMKTKLTDMVHLDYLVLAIGIALFTEYILVIVEVFQDFPNVWVALQLYFVFTIIALAFWMIVCQHDNKVIATIWLKSTIYFVLPIGLFWGIYQNYLVLGQMLNINWLFIHDTVYVVLVGQFVVTSVLLMGVKDYMEVNG